LQDNPITSQNVSTAIRPNVHGNKIIDLSHVYS
jgi:kynurenine formamidase